MRNKLSKRLLVIVLIVVIGAMVLAVWVLITDHGRNETQSTSVSLEEMNEVVQINKETHTIYDHSNGDSETLSIQDSFEISLDLVAACPDPSAELSDLCVAALDAVYTEKKIGVRRMEWINFNSPLTYRRIFSDPVQDRERVVEALRNPNCNLNDEDDIRWNLYDECHADAFANLFHFTRKCLDPNSYDNLYSQWFSIERHWIKENTPEDERDQRTRQLWEKVLETHWVVKECERFNVEEILIDPKRDQDILNKLRAAGKVLQVNDQISLDYEIRKSLQALAARFGDEWAVVTHHGSAAWRAFRAEQLPWIQTNQVLFRSDATRESKLLAGVQIALELAESELEFDWNFLVTYICTDQKHTDTTSCQTAINELYYSLDSLELDKFQILSQIERVALELGVYSPAPND